MISSRHTSLLSQCNPGPASLLAEIGESERASARLGVAVSALCVQCMQHRDSGLLLPWSSFFLLSASMIVKKGAIGEEKELCTDSH